MNNNTIALARKVASLHSNYTNEFKEKKKKNKAKRFY